MTMPLISKALMTSSSRVMVASSVSRRGASSRRLLLSASSLPVPMLGNATMLPTASFNQRRCYSVTHPPNTGSDPLHLFRRECISRKLCDEDGTRRTGAHWVLSIAANASADNASTEPPNLRTVGIQRLSSDGIDFCVKKGSRIASQLQQMESSPNGLPLSILHLQGRIVAGESAEQWRGDGLCYAIPLKEILPHMPSVTITSMVASQRIQAERDDARDDGDNDDDDATTESAERTTVGNKSHTTEVIQRTRMELESGDLSFAEQVASIQAVRFVPYRLECMKGGPDSIMWERWEWKRPVGNDDDWKSAEWESPNVLLPH